MGNDYEKNDYEEGIWILNGVRVDKNGDPVDKIPKKIMYVQEMAAFSTWMWGI